MTQAASFDFFIPSAKSTARAQDRSQEHTFNVSVTFRDGYYTACCPKIGLVTEAKTYYRLKRRANLVGGDIAGEYGYSGKINLIFDPDPCA
jgi:hypothetical protein